MAQRRISSRHISLSMVLVLLALIASGCGGAKMSAGSPTPTPTPGPTSANLAATPNNVGFGSLALNTTSSQTIKVANTGGTAITITKDSIAGSGFSTGGGNRKWKSDLHEQWNDSPHCTALWDRLSSTCAFGRYRVGRQHVANTARIQRVSQFRERRALRKDFVYGVRDNPPFY